MKYIHFIIVFFVCIHTKSQTPALPQSKSILIIGATIHTGNGKIIENGAVGFDKGKINVSFETKDFLLLLVGAITV